MVSDRLQALGQVVERPRGVSFLFVVIVVEKFSFLVTQTNNETETRLELERGLRLY